MFKKYTSIVLIFLLVFCCLGMAAAQHQNKLFHNYEEYLLKSLDYENKYEIQ